MFDVNSRLQIVLKERDLLQTQIESIKVLLHVRCIICSPHDDPFCIEQKEDKQLIKELKEKKRQDCQRYEKKLTGLYCGCREFANNSSCR